MKKLIILSFCVSLLSVACRKDTVESENPVIGKIKKLPGVIYYQWADETSPKFSPDGNYLLIGTDDHITGPFGNLFYLKVIPADGRQYQVDDGTESEGVIPIIPSGKTKIEAGDGRMVWR